jgi:hypothetical protein
MVLRYSFKIEGTEVGYADGGGPNYVLAEGTKLDLTRENANGNLATITVSDTITTTITPAVGNEVVISRGEITSADTIIFKGNIKQIIQTPNYTWNIICADPLQKLKYDLFTTSYDKNIDPEAGELSAIASDIITNGGFTPSVVASGTGVGDTTVDKFLSNDQSRLNRLNLIQKLLNWLLYYDYNADTVRLEPKGYVLYPTTLTVGDQIKELPRWESNIENMRNKITVNGATQLDTRVDTFTGDGNETEFTLTYAPVSIETKLSGTLQVLGIDGAQTGFDYEVDVDRKVVKFVTAPPASANNVVCTYTTFIPTPVTGTSPTSISQYGLTQADKFTFDDVVTVADAEVRVQQLLNILEFGEVSTTIATDEYNIKVGNEINVVDPNQPANDGSYIVESKVINYGTNYDILKIGTPRIDISDVISTIDERLKNLEGKDAKLGGILRQLIALVRTAVTLSKESLKLEKRNMTNTLIAGHDTLSFARTGYDQESDCSLNTNHGTWNGTGVTTGTQYETTGNTATGTLTEDSTSSSTTLKIARTGVSTYYETTDTANYDVFYENATNARFYEAVVGFTTYNGSGVSIVGNLVIIGDTESGNDVLTCNRADGVLKTWDLSINTFGSAYTYIVPANYRIAMSYDDTSDTAVFVGAGGILVVENVTTVSDAFETYYTSATISSPTGVTFDGSVSNLVLVDGTNKVSATVSGSENFDAPLQRLGCGVFNGTDHKITSTVSETGIVAASFFMAPDTASRDVIELASGKVISLDGSSNVATAGLTTVTITETAMTTGTHVHISFDAITVTNPTIGFSTTYYDGNLDEIMLFNTTLSAQDKTDIQNNWFGKYHSKFANCKLWYSFDNPYAGDRRTAYITAFDTTY